MSTAQGAVSPYKLASVLLQYPTAALFDGMSELDAAAAQASPRASRRCVRAVPALAARDAAD